MPGEPPGSSAIAIDLHADTLSRILQSGLDEEAFLGSKEKGALHVNVPGAREAGLDALVLAAFVEGSEVKGTSSSPGSSEAPGPGGSSGGGAGPGDRGASGGRGVLEMAALLRKIVRSATGIVGQARSAREILENKENHLLSLVLALENAGDAAEGALEALEVYRGLGARLAGLVWYGRNSYGSGVGEGSDPDGLSALGRRAVRLLGSLGVAVDVSHLNRAGFLDVLREATGPVVATHSNARAIADHPRNLDDDQIREIAARGGVMGLCLFPKFLRDPARGPASVEDAVRHLEHIAEVGGIGCIASGADFDGIPSTPQGITGVRDLPAIADALRRRGWLEDEIAAYRGQNAFRVLQSLGD